MDGETNTETSSDFNIHEAAEEIIASGEPTTASTDSAQGAGQSAQESNQNAEGKKELSPEEILNQVSAGETKPEQFADLLKTINGFGMTKNGQPVSVESSEQLKDLIQKGFDYTFKTQQHAETVKTKEAELAQKETAFTEREQSFAQKEQAFATEQYFNNVMASTLEELKEVDPEVYQYVENIFNKIDKQYASQQSLMKSQDQKFNALTQEIQSLKQGKQTEELKGIKQNWEKELGEVQTKHAASLGKLGLVVDWKKVESAWKADASGQMTVEQALFAAYGADIQKAHQSQIQLLETKNKTNSKLINRTGVGGGQRGGKETIEVAAGDYQSILRQGLDQL